MNGHTHARHVASKALPVWFLRNTVILCGLMLIYGVLGQRTPASTILPRAGCLVTLAAAICEWRILYWRIQLEGVAREIDEYEFADRQALNIHRVQLASTAPLVHAIFFVGTLSWGFGDLLWA